MSSAAWPRYEASAAKAFLILFAISTAFPIVASLIPIDQVPTILGLLDVAVAAVTALLGFAIDGLSGRAVIDADRSKGYRLVRLGSVAILALLGLFFLQPSLVHWDVLLIGLAWRAWLLVWVLPAVLAGLRRAQSGFQISE